MELEYYNGTVDEIPKEVLEGARKIGENRKAFRRMLETYVPQVGYHTPENPRILDLGCGRCDEAYVLSGYFGNQPYGYDSRDVMVIGIDWNGTEIDRARSNHLIVDFNEERIKFVEVPNYKFIHDDAIRVKKLFDEKFDIIVARHPNVADLPQSWYSVFKGVKESINPDGILIATSFTDIEHKMLEEQVEIAGYKIALSFRNMYAIPTSHEEASIDRNILIVRNEKNI